MVRTIVCTVILALLLGATALFVFTQLPNPSTADTLFFILISIFPLGLVAAGVGLLTGIIVPTPRFTGLLRYEFEENKCCGWLGSILGPPIGVLGAEWFSGLVDRPGMIIPIIASALVTTIFYSFNQLDGA